MLEGLNVCKCSEDEINVEEEKGQTIMLFHDKDLTQIDLTPFDERLTQYEEMVHLMEVGADFQACMIYHTKGWSVNMMAQLDAYCTKYELRTFKSKMDMLFIMEEVINFLDTENKVAYINKPENQLPSYNNRGLFYHRENEEELKFRRAKNFLASLKNNPELYYNHFGLADATLRGFAVSAGADIDWTKVPHMYYEAMKEFAGEDGDINQQYKDLYRTEPLQEDDVVIKGEN